LELGYLRHRLETDYLRYLERRGISCNVASFIGATTIREHVIGFEDKAPTPQQLDEMRALVRRHIGEGFNRGDWTVCETTLADDYTARYGAEGKANVGRDHYVMVCKMLRKS